MRFGEKGKLKLRYIESFEILWRVGEVSYELALPPASLAIHPLFHMLMLRCYIIDESHVLNWDLVQLNGRLTFMEELVSILARFNMRLHFREIHMVNVQSRYHPVEEATLVPSMKCRLYPHRAFRYFLTLYSCKQKSLYQVMLGKKYIFLVIFYLIFQHFYFSFLSINFLDCS